MTTPESRNCEPTPREMAKDKLRLGVNFWLNETAVREICKALIATETFSMPSETATKHSKRLTTLLDEYRLETSLSGGRDQKYREAARERWLEQIWPDEYAELERELEAYRYAEIEHDTMGCAVAKTGIYAAPASEARNDPVQKLPGTFICEHCKWDRDAETVASCMISGCPHHNVKAPLEKALIRRYGNIADALKAIGAEEVAAPHDDPGTLKIMTALVERAYGIFTASGVLRVAEQDPDSNDPIVAWASDVRSILYRNKPAAIDSALKAVNAAMPTAGERGS